MLIFVKGHYLSLIVSGQKTTTIRPWRTCKLQPGDALLFNGRVKVLLTRVVQTTFGALTDADALADGFSSRVDLLHALREHYPNRAVDTPCVVLHFDSPTQ